MNINFKNIIILISVIILTACENQYTDNYNTAQNKYEEYKKIESKVDMTETSFFEATTEEINNKSDYQQLNQLPDKYKNFLITDGIKDEIRYYKIDDIDLDGNNEILIVTENMSNIIILREINGYISQITNIVEEFHSLYNPYEADIIEMDNTNEKYIVVRLKNVFDRPIGFDIYGLKDNRFELICHSASGTTEGYDEIVDSNGDGKYDGYIQKRDGYDYFNYDVINYYIWNENEFIYDYMDINNIPDYPKDAEEVVLQYLKLYSIYDGRNEDIKNRLKELCNGNLSYVSNYILNKDEVHEAVYFIDKSQCFDIEFFIDDQDESEGANFYVDNNQEELKDFKYDFELKK